MTVDRPLWVSFGIGEPRFDAKIDLEPGTGCWVWAGALTTAGYGRYNAGGPGAWRTVQPHRYAYESLRGEIPAGLVLDHLCKNPPCCNPEHLEAVTTSENVRRSDSPAAVNARKSRCARGHPYTPDNTRVDPTTGARGCRTCIRASDARRRQRRKEAVYGKA